MRHLFIAAAALSLATVSSPALAKHCPKDAAIVKEALGKAKGMSEMQMSKIQALHDKGVALHKSGNHGESIKVLHEATKLLGVEPYKP